MDYALEKRLKESLLPIEKQKRFARFFLFHPLHIGVYLLTAIAQYTDLVQAEIRTLSNQMASLAYVLRTACFFAFLYFILPYSWRLAAVKRIPFAVLQFLIYLAFLIVYFILADPIISNYTHVPIYIRLFNNLMIGLPIILFFGIVFGSRLSIALFGNTEMYPPFKRYRPPRSIIYEKLTPENNAPIHFVEAQSPYVLVVTDAGRELLTISFKEVMDMLSREEGWQIHRSVWIAKNQLKHLEYVKGNPRVHLKDGAVLPTNRAAVSFLKPYLAQSNLERALSEPAEL